MSELKQDCQRSPVKCDILMDVFTVCEKGFLDM